MPKQWRQFSAHNNQICLTLGPLRASISISPTTKELHGNLQCDRIWRNFANLAQHKKTWTVLKGSISIWQSF